MNYSTIVVAEPLYVFKFPLMTFATVSGIQYSVSKKKYILLISSFPSGYYGWLFEKILYATII